MAKTQLHPVEDHIIIKPIENENKTASGIILPDSNKEKPSKGVVIAVGKWKILDNGQRGPIEVNVGDIVYFTKYSPDELEVMEEGQKTKYLVVKHNSIIAIEGK